MKRKLVVSGATLEHVQFSAGGRRPQESTMIEVVLSAGLRGAKVDYVKVLSGFQPFPENPEGNRKFLVLDRLVPGKGEPICVAEEDVQTAHVPPCCWAPVDAEPAHRLYAAYNLGGAIERAGLTWDGKQVPAWADLLARAEGGDEGAAGVMSKWRAVVELGKNEVVFGARHVRRLPVHAEGLGTKPVGTIVHHPHYGEGVVVASDYWAWIEEYPMIDPNLPADPKPGHVTDEEGYRKALDRGDIQENPDPVAPFHGHDARGDYLVMASDGE